MVSVQFARHVSFRMVAIENDQHFVVRLDVGLNLFNDFGCSGVADNQCDIVKQIMFLNGF